MAKLGVNVDHVATVRQARRASEPDPVLAAALAELGGADGITVHLREDRRHIQDRDVRVLRGTVKTKLNLEMAVSDEIVAIALDVKPEQATLVPERREEITTEGGLDVQKGEARLRSAIAKLRSGGIVVSLFVDPDRDVVRRARDLGADAVELHTGRFAGAKSPSEVEEAARELELAAALAGELGLHLHAGHGLDYRNVTRIVRLPHVEELNIGHSIVSRSLFVGMERAVREMKALVSGRA
jgi:pyridoxine 5-phosphate synthase